MVDRTETYSMGMLAMPCFCDHSVATTRFMSGVPSRSVESTYISSEINDSGIVVHSASFWIQASTLGLEENREPGGLGEPRGFVEGATGRLSQLFPSHASCSHFELALQSSHVRFVGERLGEICLHCEELEL